MDAIEHHLHTQQADTIVLHSLNEHRAGVRAVYGATVTASAKVKCKSSLNVCYVAQATHEQADTQANTNRVLGTVNPAESTSTHHNSRNIVTLTPLLHQFTTSAGDRMSGSALATPIDYSQLRIGRTFTLSPLLAYISCDSEDSLCIGSRR
jgi:hypothetical protein